MTLLEVVRLARRFWMTIAFCVLVGVGAAAAYAAVQPRIYVAGSTAFVVAGGSGGSVGEAAVGSSLASDKAAAYGYLTKSGLVAKKVIEKTGLRLSEGQVIGSISYTVAPSSPQIAISVTSTNPEQAATIANAVAGATAEVASEIESGGATQSAIKFKPVTDAVVPSTPVSPNVERYLLLGLVGGAALAAAVVFLRVRLDVKIRRPDDVTDVTDVGLIGTVPQSRDLERRLHSEDLLAGAVGEALRHLRTNLMFTDPDRKLQSVVVTSARPSEGKSTVSSLLARAVALRGDRVVLVDCDLRRPKIEKLFDIEGRVGLTQVLSRSVPLDEALVETSTPGFFVLPAGRIPHNPSEVVGSERMRDLIELLSKDFLVIIDAPPTLPVTDAMILGQRVDGALIVTKMGQSSKEDLVKVLGLTKKLNVRVFGVVLNSVPQGRTASLYGYENYGYGYGGHTAPGRSETVGKRSRFRKRDDAPPPPVEADEADAHPEAAFEQRPDLSELFPPQTKTPSG